LFDLSTFQDKFTLKTDNFEYGSSQSQFYKLDDFFVLSCNVDKLEIIDIKSKVISLTLNNLPSK
jgi:hypothetical protein